MKKRLLMRVKEESEKAGLKLNLKKKIAKITPFCPITSWQIKGGKVEAVTFSILGVQNHHRQWLQPWNYKMLAPWKGRMTNVGSVLKNQRCHSADKSQYRQSYGFSSSHVRMSELDHKEDWMPRNWCFQIVVLEKTIESSLKCKDIKLINPKGNQSWIFIGSWSWSSNTLATWCKEPTHYKRPWCWDRLKAKEAGGERGWNG